MKKASTAFWLTTAFATAGLTACATVKETYGPDGHKAYTLNCSGTARGWDKCYKAAGDICGASGYTIMERSSEDTSSFSGGGNSQGVVITGGKTNERSMMISCRTSK